jgi:hypothetical protein
MTEPFKLRVLYALTDTIKTITPDNGYVYNLADWVDDEGVTMQRVFRGRTWFGDSDPIPMVSVLEGASPFEEPEQPPVDTPVSSYDWNLTVQGFVDDDPVHPTDPAYRLMAEVRRRLVVERRRKTVSHDPNILGLTGGKNLITDLRVTPGVVRPADDVSSKAYFWLTVTLGIVDNAEFPYA